MNTVGLFGVATQAKPNHPEVDLHPASECRKLVTTGAFRSERE